MIFVTVGTQLPFDRLVRAVDAWAADHPEAEVFAQIGPSEYTPRHLETVSFLDPAEFKARFTAADAVVAHAGMGAIISALEIAKPVLIMPRQAELNEHRNDHQLATARRFGGRPGVLVAKDETELPGRLAELNGGPGRADGAISPHASPELLETVRRFIQSPSNA